LAKKTRKFGSGPSLT